MRRDSWNLPSRAVLFFVVWSTGCNNTCFTFTSNPPTGTINIKVSDPQPACTLTKATGGVRLVVQTVPKCSSCSESSRIQHLFLTIRSIDVQQSSTADDDSPHWQELAPQFATQPIQIDLVGGTADRGTREPLGEVVAIPAGIYRQVRVRLVGGLPATDEPMRNIACGGASLNCAVMADGTIQPLPFDTASAELRITSERIVGGFLLIFPDSDADLVIEMRPAWSWVSSVNREVRLLSTLTGTAKIEQGVR
jgi:hypothetical protein